MGDPQSHASGIKKPEISDFYGKGIVPFFHSVKIPGKKYTYVQ